MSKNTVSEIEWKSILSVGLDVCKAKIDICLLGQNKEVVLQIQNTKKGITDFIALLLENGFSSSEFNNTVPLIIESTGDYDTLACILFSEAGLNIKEINPIITKNYVRHTIRGTKTDKTDARALANIGIVNKEGLFTYNKSKDFIWISKKISLISTLEKQIQSINLSLKNFNEVCSNLGFDTSTSVKNLELTAQEMKENIKALQKEIEEASLDEEEMNKVKLIESVTGISLYMAQVFYVSFAHKDFESKKSMYAFVGYEPRLRDSGTFVGKARISKRGNAYVRKKLFQAAFMSTMHSPFFKSIYDRLKAQGKHHFVCVIAVVKKMIHIIFSMLKNNSAFNPNFGVS